MEKTREFIRCKTVAELVGVSRGSIWNWVKGGLFPKPFKLSPQITVWDVDEVNAWLAEQRRQRGATSHNA